MKPASTSRTDLGSTDLIGRFEAAPGFVELDVTGMTCAACASRIERKLNKLDGVEASVNYATERARVRVGTSGLGAEDLIATIESVGYGAQLAGSAPLDEEARARDLLRRLVVATVLGVPVLLLSMIPALQFDGWQWVALGVGYAGDHVGSLAVPPCDGAQPPSPPSNDGHVGVGRRVGGVPVVVVGAGVHIGRRYRHDSHGYRVDGVWRCGRPAPTLAWLTANLRTSISRSRRPWWRSSWPGDTSKRDRSDEPEPRCVRCST